MDFQKLYEPYVTKEAPLVTEQIKWLQKQGIPQHIIDQAMIKVYDEIERGKVFNAEGKHTSTWALWMYLQEIARGLQKKELEVYVKNLESFHENIRQKWNDDLNKLAELERKKWPLWKKILLLRITN